MRPLLREIMTAKIIVVFVILFKFADSWMLKITPPDIYLTRNATLKALCEINKSYNIQPGDIQFRFRIDKQFAPTDYIKNNSDHFEYEVPNSSIEVINDSLVKIEHDVYSPTFTNSVLECYINDSVFTKAMVNLGDFPHNATGASCSVKNWKYMQCEITTSGKHEYFTTSWNYNLSNGNVNIKGILLVENYLIQENIFDHFKINDTLLLEVFASNCLGDGYKNHFVFHLMDLVVPDPGHLNFINTSSNDVVLLSLVFPKPDERFFVSVEVNCSSMPSIYKLGISNAIENDGRILISLPEKHLPASRNCSAFTRLKPFHYGRFSDESNKVVFRTKDRVPLKNPDIFNSSLEVMHCNTKMCDVDVYFKPLSIDEAQGHVKEHRVKLMRNGEIIKETFHKNVGMPFISIKNLSHEHMKDCLVIIEAATEAGYNNTINGQLMKLNVSIDKYLHSSEFLNKSEIHSEPLHFVILNDSHVDIVYYLAGKPLENIFIVWCLYDKPNQRCRNNFSWKQITEIKGVMEFDLSLGSKISDYNFGLQLGYGLQWIKLPCFFIATPESKPGVPAFHNVTSNISHVVLSVSLPKCSEIEAINFPGGYLVEWFNVKHKDNVMNRTYHYFDNPLVIDGLYSGIFNVSVSALPWKQGSCSEKFYFQHSSMDEDSSNMITYICIAVALFSVTVICIVYLLRKRKAQISLKIDVPKNKQFEIHETLRGYSNFASNVGASGYTITSRDVTKINSSSGDPYSACTSLKSWDNSCFKKNVETNLDFEEDSSNHSYAVTKLVDHSVHLKEKLLNVPAQPILLGSSEVYQDVMGDETEEKSQNAGCRGSGELESSSSCEPSLPEYHSIKLVTSSPTHAAVKQERILEKITPNFANNIEDVDFGNVKDNYLITHVTNSGESFDGYCERSVLRSMPICLSTMLPFG